MEVLVFIHLSYFPTESATFHAESPNLNEVALAYGYSLWIPITLFLQVKA